MSDQILTLILFGSMMLVVLSGLPVAFALGGIAVVFILVLEGHHFLGSVVMNTYGGMTNYLLVAVPLFVFMSSMLEKSNLADDFFDAIQRWVGGLRGGLAVGTVLMSVALAAMVGISAASTAILGLVALPAMLKRGYNKEIALGSVQAGGALGVLIPPSVLMIILALFGQLSVGQLFIGGIIPGIVLGSLFILYIVVRCRLQPHLGPAVPPEERANWRQRFASLRIIIFPILLIMAVMGTIFAGIATVTEAAGVGALGSILIAAVYRRLTWQRFKEACYGTLRVSCMIMWIINVDHNRSQMLHLSLYAYRRPAVHTGYTDIGPGRGLGYDYSNAGRSDYSRMFFGSRGDNHDHHPHIHTHSQFSGL